MKKMSIIFLSAFVAFMTSVLTFCALQRLAYSSDSTYFPLPTANPIMLVAPKNTNDQPPTEGWMVSTDTSACQRYYSNSKSTNDCGTGTMLQNVNFNHPSYIAQYYGFNCPDGQVMIGFNWSTWGNRYALFGRCAALAYPS